MTVSSFLDPQVLARIDNLELLARTVVDGFINGLHRSPYLGLSVDFAEHRPYMPGDDIRKIDWRVFGRTDRYYVKQFEADTNANFLVVLDISRSMDFSSGGLSKLDYARYLAACLSYFSRQQRDRVGLATIAEDIVDYVPPSAKHLDIVLHAIDRIEPAAQGNLSVPLLKVAEAIKRRSIVAIISDLYDEPENVARSASVLENKGNDVIVFQVLDKAELEFPFDEPAQFEDLESGERIPVVPERQREAYRELIDGHIADLSHLLVERRIDYYLFDTSQPLDYALFSYLSRREKLSRVR
ncbi:MAG: DUF58 domain-containing protein [Gemmatimonadetes bacterium]|uniref:DUF58 domain-containing protein n=1 Tax=Candidatus Kutchimonas denitrificans TaxID=3056748 RepID=A0AAE4Z8T0_9BACT|nr:DUF58 domain-containing protein [Gemmatimonadota bacterium]NIR74587.1 DUF58 domain-containing protein [Candidatus Kutchimonas denitrificans]NIS02777.1 DUF58 domain-containing protein [Gemmatimonadota bacterium]NIT68938.1 DUF58 domain-containing protein [Gemmatimonadota bacterium]NIU52243.1 DUF58 domain-containing protein [Gemmatimonadota bacterium]